MQNHTDLSSHLQPLIFHRVFDGVRFDENDDSLVIKSKKKGTAICNTEMESGKHLISISLEGLKGATRVCIGVVRPSEGFETFDLLGQRWFGEGCINTFGFKLNEERTDQWKGHIDSCMLSATDGLLYTANWAYIGKSYRRVGPQILTRAQEKVAREEENCHPLIHTRVDCINAQDDDCIEKLREMTDVQLLLDLDSGTLSFCFGGEFHVIKKGLEGVYCWAVHLSRCSMENDPPSPDKFVCKYACSNA